MIDLKIDNKLIGIRIMQKRKENGLSQEALSEKIGFSKNHLSSIERGKYTPTVKFLCAICNVLGETPDYYLLGRIESGADEFLDLIKSLPADSQRILKELLKS